MLPEQFGDGNDLSVILLKSVLHASVNLINLMYCTHDTILTISKLVRTLLSSGKQFIFGNVHIVLSSFLRNWVVILTNAKSAEPIFWRLQLRVEYTGYIC